MAVVGVMVLAILVSTTLSQQAPPAVKYSQFITSLEHGEVRSAVVNTNTGSISFTTTAGVQEQTQGPGGISPDDGEATTLEKYLDVDNKSLQFTSPGEPWYISLLPDLILFALVLGFIIWMARRAQGQMGGIMSIGRSRAKVYTTERPRTTFADVAGYDGVKMEIREVVDFLRSSSRFKEIGAKIPKGLTSWKCSLASAPPGCATSSRAPESRRRPSFSSTRSTRSAVSEERGWAVATTSGNRPSTRCFPKWTASRRPRGL
jgi:cell division protease FtsH